MSSWWFRLDGEFAENPKVMDLSDRAFRLHVSGLCYTTRNLTDGHLTMKAVKVVCALTAATRRHIVELRDAGLWLEHDDGYEIKDYLLHNPSSATVKSIRDARREAGRKGGKSSGEKRKKPAPTEANGEANTEASASRSASKHVTERKKPSVSSETALRLVAEQPTAQTLLGRFIDAGREHGIEVPNRVKGHLAKAIKDLLDEGQTPDAVWAGLGRMVQRRIVQPALLANFVMEAALPRTPAQKTSRYGGITAADALEIGKAMDA